MGSMKDSLRKLHIITFYLFFSFFLITLLSCTPVKKDFSNIETKDSSDPSAGGFVWGRNDEKTGKPVEELTDEQILSRQEEVLKRQEIEKKRLEKEKQDILRQEYYNKKMQELQ